MENINPRDYLKNPIVQSEILNENSSFVICSYYWGHDNVSKNSIKGLTYGQYAERLINDCKRLNINYNIERYPIFHEKKLYQLALALKGEFIMNCLNKFSGYKVIFIDVDLQILKFPVLFEVDADCWFINWNEYDFDCYNPYQIQLPGAILGFANTFNARAMLSILNKYMINNLHLAEDRSYSGIISRNFMNTYLRCVWLPESYMFMFGNHVYDPKLSKYTLVLPLSGHLTDYNYQEKDIVMIHEDFETGALDDVYESRVGKVNRAPKNEYKLKGEKLRCQKVRYRNYTDFNLTYEQYLDFAVDFKDKQKDQIFKNVNLKSIPSTSQMPHISNIKNASGPLVISFINDSVEESTKIKFVNNCKKFNLDYIIYTNGKKDYYKINKPQLFHKILKEYNRPIVYLDIYYQIKKNPEMFNVKNMDFMTFNLDQTNLHYKTCSDIRILRMLNDNLYFFANNSVTLQFLQIWYEFNKNEKYQHKNLEYAFNISMSINKLRCYWYPKEYIVGSILNFPKDKTFSFFNNIYSKMNKVFSRISTRLERCGIALPLDSNGEPQKSHHYGSKNGVTYHNKYGKLFLEY